MTEIERFEELVQVVADVVVGELGVEQPRFEVVDVLGDDRRGFALCAGRTGTLVSIPISAGVHPGKRIDSKSLRTHLRIADDIEQFDDVDPAAQVAQHFQLALDFLLLDRFQDLDDDELVRVVDVDALEDFRVLRKRAKGSD